MTRDDLFNTNASIVRDLAKAAAESAPDANILVISNPVNSTVPIVAEIFKAKGVYNPKRLFGVTTLDVVRASRFVSEIKKTDPVDENIVVVGGHSGVTIVPLFSQSSHPDLVGDATLLNRVQFGGDEVVKAKDGAGSATLSMAMAGARFAESLLKAAQGQKGVVEPTFVDSPLYKDQGIDFFASKVELGPNGVEKIHDVGKVHPEEQKLLDACLADLKKVRKLRRPHLYAKTILTFILRRTSTRVSHSLPKTQESKCAYPAGSKGDCRTVLDSEWSSTHFGELLAP
jgi:malate dehydrogenase